MWLRGRRIKLVLPSLSTITAFYPMNIIDKIQQVRLAGRNSITCAIARASKPWLCARRRRRRRKDASSPPDVAMKCSHKHERALYAQGHSCVAGLDEVGRGPLAGPVVAAAVVLPRKFRHT